MRNVLITHFKSCMGVLIQISEDVDNVEVKNRGKKNNMYFQAQGRASILYGSTVKFN